MSTATDSSASILERVQLFVVENKQAVIIGTAAAVLAAGGVAYYASTSRAHGRLPDGDLESGERKSKKRGSRSGKRKSTKEKDEPILEEIPKAKVEDVPEESDLSAERIASLSDEERTKLAGTLKTKGNDAYQKRKFDEAADFYSNAIRVTPKPESVFYSNRAACYVNMQPPKHELVIADCDEALKLDANYVKALNRRATALEALGLYEGALRDFTAATILDKFQNEAAAQAVERVLKKYSAEDASMILLSRERRLPSFTFISAYFAAFRIRPHPLLPDEPSTGDQTLRLALEALEASAYAHSFTLANEASEQGISTDAGKAEALNLRGTFKFLCGDVVGAKEDLLASVELVPSLTQSMVKLASVYMEQGDPKKAFECFDDAIKQNPNDPDIYYHRGQVLFIMNEFAEASKNYTKSTELDDQFVFSHIQLAVAQYKTGQIGSSMATFRRTLKAFPQRSEPQNYYGELLLDQQRFEDAVEKFERAVEIEVGRKPPINVLPLVNKGLALYQWKQDIGAAERCCNEALRIDPECEAAVATLAQLNLQQGKIKEAVGFFKRQAELARSEPELANALTYQYASTAQMTFLDNYPDQAAQLNQLARMM